MVYKAEQYNKPSPVIAYCAAIEDKSVSEICYQALFAFLSQNGSSIASVQTLCPATSPLCLEGAQKYQNIS